MLYACFGEESFQIVPIPVGNTEIFSREVTHYQVKHLLNVDLAMLIASLPSSCPTETTPEEDTAFWEEHDLHQNFRTSSESYFTPSLNPSYSLELLSLR